MTRFCRNWLQIMSLLRSAPRRGFTKRGFTLIELLVVLGILTLLMTVVPPLFSGTLDDLKVRSAARDLAATLRLARSTAVSSGRETIFSVDVNEKKFAVNNRNKRFALPRDTAIALTTARTEQISESSGAIRFFPDGSSTGGRLTLEHGARIYRIDVNWITGKVAMSR